MKCAACKAPYNPEKTMCESILKWNGLMSLIRKKKKQLKINNKMNTCAYLPVLQTET